MSMVIEFLSRRIIIVEEATSDRNDLLCDLLKTHFPEKSAIFVVF